MLSLSEAQTLAGGKNQIKTSLVLQKGSSSHCCWFGGQAVGFWKAPKDDLDSNRCSINDCFKGLNMAGFASTGVNKQSVHMWVCITD